MNDKTDYYNQLRQDDKYFLQQVKSQFGTMSNNDLVRYTYINYPYWATKSTIANKVLSSDEYEKILQSKPKSDKTILYTIGYEGISLEEYLNRLIKNDVKVLVDVRRNPLSMKYVFSKNQLSRYCGNAGIEYLHYPEVGIELVCTVGFTEDGKWIRIYPVQFRKKYYDDFAKTKDLYFFLGTAQVHHFVSKNPFMIIGVFYPKKESQGNLF